MPDFHFITAGYGQIAFCNLDDTLLSSRQIDELFAWMFNIEAKIALGDRVDHWKACLGIIRNQLMHALNGNMNKIRIGNPWTRFLASYIAEANEFRQLGLTLVQESIPSLNLKEFSVPQCLECCDALMRMRLRPHVDVLLMSFASSLVTHSQAYSRHVSYQIRFVFDLSFKEWRVNADASVRLVDDQWIIQLGDAVTSISLSSGDVEMAEAVSGVTKKSHCSVVRRKYKRDERLDFQFSEVDPGTWHFDAKDAFAFPKRVRHHAVVIELGSDTVSMLLLKRRGSPIHVAFKNLVKRFEETHKKKLATPVALPPKQQVPLPLLDVDIPYAPDTPFFRVASKVVCREPIDHNEARLFRKVCEDNSDFHVTDVVKKSGVNAPDIFTTPDESSEEEVKQPGKIASFLAGYLPTMKVKHELPKGVKDFVNKVKTSTQPFDVGLIVKHLLDTIGIPKSASQWVSRITVFLRDTFVLYSCDSAAGLAAATTLVAENRGLAYSLGAVALVTLMKQFTRWGNSDAVEKKAGFDYTTSDIGGIINTMRYVLFGTVGVVMATNATYTFGKNFPTLAEFVIDVVKTSVNCVWSAITGHKLIQTEYDRALEDIELQYKNLQAGVEVVSHDRRLELVELLRRLEASMVKLAALGGDKVVLQKWETKVRLLKNFIGNLGVEVEYVSSRQVPVTIVLRGATGVGKTTVAKLLADAVGAIQKWDGPQNQWHSVFNLDTENGFQALPAYCHSLQVDEPFVNMDTSSNATQVFNFLLLGGNQPYQNEGPGVDQKSTYIRPKTMFITLNLAGNSGTVNPEASNRRCDFVFDITVAEGRSGSEIYETTSVAELDRILVFTSDKAYVFSAVAAAIAAAVEKYRLGALNFEALSTKVREFEYPKGMKVGKNKNHKLFDTVGKKANFSLEYKRTNFGKYKLPEVMSMISAHEPDLYIGSDEQLEQYFIRHYGEMPKNILPHVIATTATREDGQVCLFHNGPDCVNHKSPLCLLTGERQPVTDDLTLWGALLSKGKYIGKKIIAYLELPVRYGSVLFSSILLGLEYAVVFSTAAVAALVLTQVLSKAVLWLMPSLGEVEKKSYSGVTAVQTANTMEIPRFQPAQTGGVLPKSETQAVDPKASFVVASRIGTHESLTNVVNKMLLPVFCVYIGAEKNVHTRVQLQLISGQLGWSIKHAFTFGNKRPNYLILVAPFNKVIPIAPVDGFNPANSAMVQTLFSAAADMTFVLLPKGMIIAPDLTNRYIDKGDLQTSLMSECVVFYKGHPQIEFDDETMAVVVTGPSTLMTMPHGQFTTVKNILYSDEGGTLALSFNGCPETPAGACCGPVISTNPRFGGGGRVLGMGHCGHSRNNRQSFAVYLLREDIEFVKATYPWINNGVKIVDNSGVVFATELENDFAKKSAVGFSDKIGYLPGKTDLERSLVFDCMSGATTDGIVWPAVSREPAKVRDVEASLSKYPPHIKSPPQDVVDDAAACANAAADFLINAVRGDKLKRDQPLSWLEAINGTADGLIKGLNKDSSWGFSLVHNGKVGNKHEFLDEIYLNVWDLKSEFKDEAELIFQGIMDGTFYYAIAKTTPKSELRPFNKVARLTSSLVFFVFLAMRRIVAPLQQVVIAGAPFNGTARAVDPTGPSGHAMWVLLQTFLKKMNGDAKTFDASQDATLSNTIEVVLLTRQLMFVFGWSLKESLPRATVLAMYGHLAWEVVGNRVFWHIDGNISGQVRTPDTNDNFTAVCVRMAWLHYYRSAAYSGVRDGVWVSFEKHLKYCSVGDDMSACTDASFSNFEMQRGYKLMQIRYTTSDKSDEIVAYNDNVEFVRRVPKKFHGFWVGVLPLENLANTLSYIRTKIMTREEATSLNAGQSLAEALFFGRNFYEETRAHLNGALADKSCPMLPLTFTDAVQLWSEKFSSPYESLTHALPPRVTGRFLFGVVKKSSSYEVGKSELLGLKTNPGAGEMPLSARQDFLAAAVSKQTVGATVEENRDMTMVKTDGSDRATTAPAIKTATQLTKFSDALTTLTKVYMGVPKEVFGPLDPYPDQQVTPLLRRSYKIADVSWALGDLVGQSIAQLSFPEGLFVIPKISATLSAFRYGRLPTTVDVRINASPFIQGRLMICSVPATGQLDSYRSNYQVRKQGPHILLSPSSGQTVSIEIPWLCPKTMKDLTNASQTGYCGLLEIYVMHKLKAASPVSPDPVIVTIFAHYEDPVVAGLDLNSGPSIEGVTKKSGSEDVAKATTGALIGVGSAMSQLVGAIKEVGALVTGVAAMLDKPQSVASTQFVVPKWQSDMILTKGTFNSNPICGSPDARVSTDPSIQGTEDGEGGVIRLAQRPGVVLEGSIPLTGSGSAPGDQLFDIPVAPNIVTSLGPPVDDVEQFSCPPLAYASQFFARWRGSFKYIVIFSASKMTTARVRLSYVPDSAFVGPVPETNAGDVVSEVVSIQGDTVAMFPVPYISDGVYRTVETFATASTSQDGCIGRFLMSVINPIATSPGGAACEIDYTVYVAAGEDFQLARPDGWDATWDIDTSVIAGVSKKCDVYELMKKPFSGPVAIKLSKEQFLAASETATTWVQIMKRFEYIMDVGAAGDSVEIPNGLDGIVATAPYTNPWHRRMCTPYLTWRGGSHYKVILQNPPSTATQINDVRVYLVPTSGASNSESELSLTGRYKTFTGYGSMNQQVEFYVPFNDLLHCREVVKTLPDLPSADQVTIYASPDPHEIWWAVGDDFTLGAFVGIPLLLESTGARRRKILAANEKRLGLQRKIYSNGDEAASSSGAPVPSISNGGQGFSVRPKVNFVSKF